MLMSLPGPKNVTPHAEKLLQVIQDAGDWINRREIAAGLGKKRLTTWELGLLDILASEGKVKAAKRPRAGNIEFEHIYRSTK